MSMRMIWKRGEYGEMDEIYWEELDETIIAPTDAPAEEGASISEQDFDRIRDGYGEEYEDE